MGNSGFEGDNLGSLFGPTKEMMLDSPFGAQTSHHMNIKYNMF